MKASVLLLVMMAVVAIQAHNVNRERESCEDVRDAAAEGEWAPVCTNKGNYKNKQCNDDKCWCVSKKRGRPIFKRQQVPLNHRYDCKRRPKPCLKNELDILMSPKKKKRNQWIPECDCFGYYEKKQCKPVTCPGRKKRDHPTCGVQQVIGFACNKRPKLDTAEQWSFVSKAAFSNDATVTAIEIFVGDDVSLSTTLRVGIYRPTGSGTACEFTLIEQEEWTGLTPGQQTISLSPGFDVKAGDRYGFSWLGGSGGVILYENVEANFFCENDEVYHEGDTVLLNDNRYGKREYSIRLLLESCDALVDEGECDGTPASLGFNPIARPKTDTKPFWTMVSKDHFTSDGEIKSFEVYVSGEARGLRVGIYRPIAACRYELIQQQEWTGFMRGLVKVNNGDNVIFDVKAGDTYGFTWLNFGVIAYDTVAEQNFCEKEQMYDVGDIAQLDSNYGNRVYSIRMELIPCPGVTPKCEECFCVDMVTGETEAGTETTDGDSLECD